MKVLQIGSSMPLDWGGIERYVAFLSEGLAARGHDLTLACPASSPLAQRSGTRVLPLRLRHKYDLVALASYLRHFRRQRYDIVHTHFSPDYLMPAYAARLAGQGGVVMTRHLAIGWRQPRVRAYRRLYARIVSVSEAVRTALLECGIPPGFVTTAHAGVPALAPSSNRMANRERFGISTEEFALGVFGRLTPEKGHAALFRCARSVDGLVVHVFGDGPLRASLADLAADTSVRFHGQVPDVADAMDAMDAVAIPSVWAEAFSIAALEALSLGKPMVASPVGGIPELLTDGETGLLANPVDDPGAFTRALERLKDDEALRFQLSSRCLALHRKEYTVERFAERIEAVYLELE